MAPGVAGAQAQNTPTPRRLIEIAPALKRGADYETPTDAAAINACKVETVYKGKNHAIGVALRDGQGKLLRKFVDSDDNGRMDQWSFYQDGFEVYRETDRTNDATSDECRWLNAAGTRVGVLKDGKITAWKRISAEEAAKVLVQALVTADLALLETVLATPDELAKLGIPKGEIDQVTAASAQRHEQTNALIKGLTGWNKEFVWNRLDGMMPHLIPADPDTGLTQDVVLYENAVIFAGPASGEIDPRKIAFLQVPEMIKVGDVWKFVELPRAIPPDKPVVAAADGGIRSWIFRSQTGASPAGPQNPELDAALRALAAFDQKGAAILAGNDQKAIAQFHVERVGLLKAVVKAAKGLDEQLTYKKQIIDSLVAAVQTGLFRERREGHQRDGGRGSGRPARVVRGLPQARGRLRPPQRGAGRQPDGQPEEMDERPEELPGQVSAVGRGPRGAVATGQRLRVQRRGGRGSQVLHPAHEGLPRHGTRQEGGRCPGAA
jgi:hypothetical protein